MDIWQVTKIPHSCQAETHTKYKALYEITVLAKIRKFLA
jgi:hypothetical protein